MVNNYGLLSFAAPARGTIAESVHLTVVTVRSLSFHSTYRCRHRGACCTASWPIPVEADRLRGLCAAIGDGRLQPAVEEPADAFESPADAPAETPALLRVVDHRCVFFDESAGRTCRVHASLGHEALPLACRQFPRVVVIDPRGVSVTLSHYCPTAAAMLGDPSPVCIVESPPAFPSEAEYVGLDVRTALPPLLRPDVLMDWESWWAFEARAVDLLGNAADPAAALRRLRSIVEQIRTWSPGEGRLRDRVDRTFNQVRLKADATTESTSKVLSRFLAAHAFANWTAHLGGGLRTWWRSIEAARAQAAETHDVAAADLHLRHLADPDALAAEWSAVEGDAATRRFPRRAGRASRSAGRR